VLEEQPDGEQVARGEGCEGEAKSLPGDGEGPGGGASIHIIFRSQFVHMTIHHFCLGPWLFDLWANHVSGAGWLSFLLRQYREDLEWVHVRRERDRERHTQNQMAEIGSQLCRQQLLGRCFRTWCSLSSGFVNKQLKLLLEKAEKVASSQKARTLSTSSGATGISGGGGSGGVYTLSFATSANVRDDVSWSMLAVERRGMARERMKAMRRAKAATAAAPQATATPGLVDSDERKSGESEEDEDDDDDDDEDEEELFMSSADVLEKHRRVVDAAVKASTCSNKENLLDFDVDLGFSESMAINSKYTVEALRTAANRMLDSPPHT